MSVIDNYNPRVIKERWNRVKGSPYASLKFQYMATKAVVVCILLFICYTLIKVIINYDGGSATMTMAIRGVMLVVMVVVVLKTWGILGPLKKSLEQYEKNPSAQKSTGEKIDVAAEVDEILANIEKRKKEMNSHEK